MTDTDTDERDDLARALIAFAFQETAEQIEQEVGHPIGDDSCGGQTFDPPCGGCSSCMLAIATHHFHDADRWPDWQRQADFLLANARGQHEFRQRQASPTA